MTALLSPRRRTPPVPPALDIAATGDLLAQSRRDARLVACVLMAALVTALAVLVHSLN